MGSSSIIMGLFLNCQWLKCIYDFINNNNGIIDFIILILLIVYLFICYVKNNKAGDFKSCFYVVLNLLALIFSVMALSMTHPNQLGFDYLGAIVGILAILVTILLGWNIYSIIDIKSIKKETNEQIKESSLKFKDEIKRDLDAKINSKFKHFDARIGGRFQKERVLNVYLGEYKYALKLSEENNEEAFRIFMRIAANCDSLDDGVTNEALMRAHEIASSVIYGDEKTKKSYIDAVNKLRIERQKQFYKMARSFMDKYMKKPLLPNSLFDKEDLEGLSKFIDEKYNASNRQ